MWQPWKRSEDKSCRESETLRTRDFIAIAYRQSVDDLNDTCDRSTLRRIAIPAQQAQIPPLIRHARTRGIGPGTLQILPYNVIQYHIFIPQMIEWTPPGKQLLEIELDAINGGVIRQLASAVIPKAQMSPAVFIVNSTSCKYSGAIQFKVPPRRWSAARLNDASARCEKPKSVRRPCPSSDTNTLSCYEGLSN